MNRASSRAPFALALLLATGACGVPDPGLAGVETGPCLDDQCFNGLQCLSNLCVAPDGGSEGDGGDDDGGPFGDDGGPGDDGNPGDGGADADPDDDGDPDAGDGPDPTTGSVTDGDDGDDGGSTSGGMDDAAEETTGDTSGDDDSAGDTSTAQCAPPPHAACDGAGSAFAALGINCAGETQFDVSTFGNPAAIGVRSSFGGTDTWDPTEGSQFAVIGSGFTTDLDMETPAGETGQSPTHCSDDLGAEYDAGAALPEPLTHVATAGDCALDPTLVGTGDCSGSIATPWTGGGSANDYTEIRIEGTAAGAARSVSFDFAFFSAEYPFYVGNGQFNDMFVAWLESEDWTGNVSFDSAGDAITASSSMMDIADDDATAPEFEGTCMRSHAGSEWLRTTAPLAPSESFTLVFAVFDLSDSIVDSYAFIDNVEFGCEDLDVPETTAAL